MQPHSALTKQKEHAQHFFRLSFDEESDFVV
jgi:hypothetical protein